MQNLSINGFYMIALITISHIYIVSTFIQIHALQKAQQFLM